MGQELLMLFAMEWADLRLGRGGGGGGLYFVVRLIITDN